MRNPCPLSDGAWLRRHEIGSFINDIEYSPTRNRIYVTTSGGLLVEIDPVTGDRRGRFTVGGLGFESNGIGVGPNGNVYITRHNAPDNDAVRVYEPIDFREICRGGPPPDRINFSGIAFLGDYFYISSRSGQTGPKSHIEEYRTSDCSWNRTVQTFPYSIGGLARASDTSLWAEAPDPPSTSAVIEVDVRNGQVLRALNHCGAPSGGSDIEVAGGRVPSNKLLVNPDFELGNQGFSSDYAHDETLGPAGVYYVGNRAWQCSQDHTSGTGLMMLVNGSVDRDHVVWRQVVDTQPNDTYQFSFWTTSCTFPLRPRLQVSINGTPLGNPIPVPSGKGVWARQQLTWNSGGNKSGN